MSKQSLVEFQVKLMNRLQSAESAGNLASWLAIEVAEFKYIIPLSEAGEVIPLKGNMQIEKIAHTQDWFLGVVNFRGAPFATVDLAGWLGVRADKPNLSELARTGASFIAFHASLGMSCALLVDKITGLRSDSDWTKAEAPKDADKNAEYLEDVDGQVWQVMRLSDLARDEYFLSVEQ